MELSSVEKYDEILVQFPVIVNNIAVELTVTNEDYNVLSTDDEELLTYVKNVIRRGFIPDIQPNVSEIVVRRNNNEDDTELVLQIAQQSNNQHKAATETCFEEMLISLVSKYPALFNPTVPLQNRTLNIRSEIWDTIHNQLNKAGFKITLEAVKSKWKYLRDHFSKLKTIVDKHVPTGSAANCQTRKEVEKAKSWKYYQSVTFLNDTLERRPTTSNLTLVNTPNMENQPSVSVDETGGSKKRKKDDDVFLNKLEPITNSVKLSEIPKNDEVQDFCQHLAAGMRRLPIPIRYNVEIQFLKILSEAHALLQ